MWLQKQKIFTYYPAHINTFVYFINTLFINIWYNTELTKNPDKSADEDGKAHIYQRKEVGFSDEKVQ